MNVEIIAEPIRFHLHGIGGVVENEHCSEVGLRLMNEMWRVVKGAGIQTTGIILWSNRRLVFEKIMADRRSEQVRNFVSDRRRVSLAFGGVALLSVF